MHSFLKNYLCVFSVCLIGFSISGCSGSPSSPQDTIDNIARDMQAQLPKKLDRDTTLVKVFSRKLELVSEYELNSYRQTEADDDMHKKKIELYLRNEACPAIKQELLNRGISSRYIYRDGDGRLLLSPDPALNEITIEAIDLPFSLMIRRPKSVQEDRPADGV